MTDLEMILIWTNITTVCLWVGFEIERFLQKRKARANVPVQKLKNN